MRRTGSGFAIVGGLLLAGCQAAQVTVGPSDSVAPGASTLPAVTSTPLANGTASATPSTKPSPVAPLGPGRWVEAGTLAEDGPNLQGVVLADGRVLAVGTADRDDVTVPVADLWDPASERWSAIQPLPAVRDQFALVALPDGRALVAGGANADRTSYSSTYVFDPTAATWSKVGLLATARTAPSAAVLPDGRVLVAGGYYRNNATSTITSPAILAAYRVPSAFTQTPLADVDIPPSGYALATSEIFDPTSGMWSDAGTMRYARTGAPATALPDGRILLVGAADYNVSRLDGRAYETAEIYDPVADRFTPAGELPELDRAALQKLGAKGANPIPDHDPQPGSPGQLVTTADRRAVLIGVAGWWKHVGDVSRSFRYDGASGGWSEIDRTFITVLEPGLVPLYRKGVPDRSTAAVAALLDGRVLVAGGNGPLQRMTGGSYETPTSDAVAAYDAATNVWTTLSKLPEARSSGQAVVLRDGSVLLFGGSRRTTDGGLDVKATQRFLPGK